MKQKKLRTLEQPWHKKPGFGSLYTMESSKYIYISMYYFKQRLRFPTDKEDTPRNWDELSDFLEKVGQKIKNRTFVFAKAFYWLDEETKAHFTALEGNDYKPEPAHVEFGDYAEPWMEQNVTKFASISKQRYYVEAFESRILPHFKTMTFANITGTVIASFIDNMKRSNGSDKPLSTKRIKSIIGPLCAIWEAACIDHNWILKNPFSGVSAKYKEIEDRAAQAKERQAVLMDECEDDISSTRDVFLLSEWLRFRNVIDPHYHPVLELLAMGMIGSELEGLLKRNIKENTIQVRSSVVRGKEGKIYLKFKPKNWFRKRDIPMTSRIKLLMEQAATASTSDKSRLFEGGIDLPAHAFLLTMKDGSPFSYSSFRKMVWNKGVKSIGLDGRVPYSLRHTFVQWSLLIGVAKPRMVDLMGHCNKDMVDRTYGKYRQGLVEEREKILDYLGEDFLALEELRTYFPDRYRARMAVDNKSPETLKAPVLAATFSQSFSQSQGLFADNYS
jgi:integrase